MPRFRYRMQSILDIKQKLETQAKNELAQAQILLNEEEEKKRRLLERQAAYEAEGVELRKKTLNVRRLNENSHAVSVLKDMVKAQEFEIMKAAAVVDNKRKALAQVMQERKMHEKLKEKAYEEYLEEEKEAETKSIDELTSFTHGAKQDEI